MADQRTVETSEPDRIDGLPCFQYRCARLELRAHAEIGRRHGGNAQAHDHNSGNQRNRNDLK